MGVDRWGNPLQAGRTPARFPRRIRARGVSKPYCVWKEVIESEGVIRYVVRVYQHLHAVSATVAINHWGKEEQVVLLPMYHSSYEEEQTLRKVAMASALKALYKRMEQKVAGARPQDPTFEGQWPAMYDFLTLTEMEGKSRELGTITVFAQDGKWKATLQDKETKHYCFVSADTMEGLLEAVEGALTNEEHEWRESKPFTPTSKKK